MRILYDGLIYSIQTAGGINRYFAKLIGLLPRHWTPILTAARRQVISYPEHPRLELHLREMWRWPKPVRSVVKSLQRRHFRRLQGTVQADVLHPTYFGLLSQMDWKACTQPVVLNVHDLVHEHFRAEMDPQGKTAEAKRRAIAAATAIICGSEHAKADLLEFYHPPEEKITVIPHASDLQPVFPAAQATAEPPYFLYVGTRRSYKNFARLLAALRNVVGRYPDVSLRVVGAPFQPSERAQLAQGRLEGHIRHCGYVTDHELASLYRDSVAFVYPSLYEGFGIPLLEAMSCGSVVVASNRTSIPEVVGDAGILFDPDSTDELTEILTSLLKSPEQRWPLIDKGYRRAQQFSWKRTAEQTMAVYETVAGTPVAARAIATVRAGAVRGGDAPDRGRHAVGRQSRACYSESHRT